MSTRGASFPWRFSKFPRAIRLVGKGGAATTYLRDAGALSGWGLGDAGDQLDDTTPPSAINPDPAPAIETQRPIWVDPPTSWENLDVSGYVSMPAIGATATVISFTVPTGRNGVVYGIANNFIGGGWTEGSGAVYWQILVNGAAPPGATSYSKILDSLGSIPAPTRIAGFRIMENQVVSIAVTNVSIVVAGQLIGGRLLGHFYPKDLEADSLWV